MTMTESAFVRLEPSEWGVVADVVCERVGGREAPIVQQELLAAAEGNRWRIVVDLSLVTLLSSMGLGGLVTLNRRCRERSGAMAVCGLGTELLALLKLTHLDRVLTVAPDRAGAIKAIT